MSPSPGLMAVNKRTLLTFTAGVTFGFVLTYYLLSVGRSKEGHEDGPRRAQQTLFLPNSPHSAGETDHLVGPEKEQRWDDFHADNHNEEDTVARDLTSKVRVLCWVMTSPTTLSSKARHVKATWGRRCNVLLFMSSRPDDQLPAIGLPVPEGRDHLWGKTKEAFKYVYKHHLDQVDWVLKADDDTYVVLENLRHLLETHDASRPLYLGRRFKPYVKQGYMSGGAGYVLSKEAVKRFVETALPDPTKCRQDDGGAEDLEMGQSLQRVGVKIIDSRDPLGRETFHPFVPEHHLIPGLVPRDNWYWEYNYYPAQEGPSCCSDYAITFHYVPPNMMYVFEYFVYHLKPFGVDSRIVLPSEKYQPESNALPESHHTKITQPSKAYTRETDGLPHRTQETNYVNGLASGRIQNVKSRKKTDKEPDRTLNDATLYVDSAPRSRVKLVPRQT